MKISGKTKLLGILGNPVGHTLSPPMQNAALRAAGLDYCYLPFDVSSGDLGRALAGLRVLGCAGLNVTVPHKQSIIPHLDRLTREARLIGAVNTVEFKGRRLIGHNTDGRGFIRAFNRECRRSLRGKTIVIIGAGGAARAVSVQLLLEGVRRIIVANRTPRKGGRLARDLARIFPGRRLEAVPLRSRLLPGKMKDAHVVINASSCGLKKSDRSPISTAGLFPGLIVVDLIYNPPLTGLLKAARSAGCEIHNGMGMLLHQGALSFEIWTGRKPDLEVMKKSLLTEISE
jgi:shikimate dehydrogenase